ncbi:YciI family protein [Coprobacter tertius]|uniref:YciI family protein n=1 Tax=Coprobacter tertius TaxID=2944915 RepID=A0ABT1MGG4_9BACT|nr:YciI family protein [Coprobacter tertius]MCP9611725.1 YciI family protein [Coprobacter tertius]
MTIAVLTYKKELSEVEKSLQEHRIYLDKYYSSGKFIASGAQTPRIGGIILMNITKEEAQLLIKEDPFFRNDVAEYELIEFSPTKYQVGFEQFIKR